MNRSVDRNILTRMRKHRVIGAVNDFMRTPWYVVLIALMTAVSYVFSLELPLYTVFILIGLYLSLLGQDYLPMMPIVICCYIAPSFQNNPGRQEESIFYPQNGGIYLIVLASLLVLSIVLRIATDKSFGTKRFWTEKRALTGGMLLLGAAYLLSGVGMAGYLELAADNLLFAVIQFAAIIVMYWFFTGAVCWDKAPKDYFAWTGMCMGFVVMIELLENYLSGRVFEGTILNRELIATGWGMHNNVGGMMAIAMPFAFYLAAKKRHGWIFTILGTLLMLGTVASCSRTAMAVGAAAYCICAVLLLRRKETGKTNLRVFLIAALALAILLAVFFEKILAVYDLFIQQLDDVSKRDQLIINGLKQFLAHPIFGGSFYPQGEFVPWDWADLEEFSSFFPPRWHNTIVQIAASCGVVGLAAYGFHRFQTVKLFWKRRSVENTYIAISIFVLLAASLLDCHFFNVGPVLLYSMALAFAERIPQT